LTRSASIRAASSAAASSPCWAPNASTPPGKA